MLICVSITIFINKLQILYYNSGGNRNSIYIIYKYRVKKC